MLRFFKNGGLKLLNKIGVNIWWFCLLIVIALASCTKIEAQYAVCNLAQNVDPFICYGILDD